MRTTSTVRGLGVVAASCVLAVTATTPASAHGETSTQASSHRTASAVVVRGAGAVTDLQPAAADPTDGATARAVAVGHHGRTVVVLHLRGLDRSAAGRTFGAHVHTGACVPGDGAAAGPHYNHDVATGVSPATVSNETEVWLDFTVSRGGSATAVAHVPFTIAPGAAGSIVLHQSPTDHTGAAGPRLACLPMGF